jgi:hypothetical protein
MLKIRIAKNHNVQIQDELIACSNVTVMRILAQKRQIPASDVHIPISESLLDLLLWKNLLIQIIDL